MNQLVLVAWQVGETKTVELYPSMDDLTLVNAQVSLSFTHTLVNAQGERYVVSGDYTFAFGVRHAAGATLQSLSPSPVISS